MAIILEIKRLLPVLCTIVLIIFSILSSQAACFGGDIRIEGRKLILNGKPFIVRGVGYAPVPIGIDPESTPPYGDYFTVDQHAIYERDFPWLRGMNANTIRLWGWNNTADHTDFLDKAYNNGDSPIYVIVTFWMGPAVYPDVSSPPARKQIKTAFRNMVAANKNHPAVLMWAIGNEVNASLHYGSKLGELFSLINEMALEAHMEEGPRFHPVTTPLADIDFVQTIAAYDSLLPNLDVWSVQAYRGITFSELFSAYQKVSKKPLAILEYGIDAYDDTSKSEYESSGPPHQGLYAKALWKEIEANSDTCIGGSLMAYSDEWWKGKHGRTDGSHAACPEHSPSFHSACGHPAASHPDGYANEEWWGVMRTRINQPGLDELQPRAVYYILKDLWK